MRVATLAIIAVPILIIFYVAGYFYLPERSRKNWQDGTTSRWRIFNRPWQAKLYRPLGQLESLLTIDEVLVDHWCDRYATHQSSGKRNVNLTEEQEREVERQVNEALRQQNADPPIQNGRGQ